jgi:hypothetical protein
MLDTGNHFFISEFMFQRSEEIRLFTLRDKQTNKCHEPGIYVLNKQEDIFFVMHYIIVSVLKVYLLENSTHKIIILQNGKR